MKTKFDAPSQPNQKEEVKNQIILTAGSNFENALKDLNGFDRIWIIWWFHKNSRWRPMVLPPRGNGKRRGLFATRSPHRPNPIGMTSTRLYGISGRTLTVGELDLVDGTPILDIKPYIPEIDAFNNSAIGWLGEVIDELAAPVKFKVEISTLAAQQIEWLKSEWKEDFTGRAIEILKRDPNPHRTRRISRRKLGGFKMGCGPWQIIFSVKDEIVTIESLAPGYPPRLLQNDEYDEVPARDAQLAFMKKWGQARI